MIRLCLFLLFFPSVIVAQQVSIRSGEHDTFSRLVIAIGDDTQWDVAPTEGGFILSLTGREDGFDPSEVFERIPRTRLINLTQIAPDQLFLATGCDCGVDAFLWRSGQLVVDIVDPDTLADGDPSVQIAPQLRPLIDVTNRADDSSSRLPDVIDLLQRQTANETALEIPGLAARMPSPVEARVTTRTPGPSLDAVNLLATQTALIEGLARAATQGVLVTAPVPVEPMTVNPETTELAPVTEPEPELLQEPSVALPGIGITTSIDRDLAGVIQAIEARTGSACLPADLFQVDQWGDGRAFHDQAADMAAELAGEFGEEPREAQEALARLYLHFGFGAEARAVLAADTAQSQARQVLMELAGIMDDLSEAYPVIAEQAGCATPGALWSMITTSQDLDEDARNHILQEFFGLPLPLRSQIAPRLASRFIAIQDAERAARVLGATVSRDAEATHDVQATRAQIAEEFESPQDAIEILSQEIDDNVRATPQSLIRLIDLRLTNGALPLEADLVLAAAMRQEYRNQPIADDLAVAEAAGRISRGEYQMGLDLMVGREDQEALATIDLAYAHITRAANSAEFLEFGYRGLPPGLSAQTENAIARRMIDLGFSERATDILRGPAEREAAGERRYLRAEAAIGASDFNAAIDGLLGLTDPRARDLRMQAYAGLGEYRAALSASDQGELQDPTLQFRAGAWERLTITDDDTLASFAQTVLTPQTETPPQTLADRRALLAQSQESRRAVEGLLSRFDGVATPAE